MATALTPQAIIDAGLDPVYTAALAVGHSIVNSDTAKRLFIHVKNGSAATMTTTVAGQTACSQGVIHDEVVSVPPTDDRMIGPLLAARFNDAGSLVQATYSATTDITVAALTLAIY